MALKNWKRFHSKSYDKHGIMLWEKNKGNWKVSVSKYDYSKPPKNYQVQITNKEEARKGYPHSKVGITKSQALKFAKAYMRSH